MIGYCFVNDKDQVRNISGEFMPEIYLNKKDAEFMKRNHKEEYKGWTVRRVSLFVYKPMKRPKHVQRVGEPLDISM